nr:MAG TPA: hypothetical protein [Caudoviricetes sp.]
MAIGVVHNTSSNIVITDRKIIPVPEMNNAKWVITYWSDGYVDMDTYIYSKNNYQVVNFPSEIDFERSENGDGYSCQLTPAHNAIVCTNIVVADSGGNHYQTQDGWRSRIILNYMNRTDSNRWYVGCYVHIHGKLKK